MGPLAPTSGSVALTSAEFDAFRAVIHDASGIALAPAKRTLLESRLQRRLRALGLSSFSDYLDAVGDAGSPEFVEMLNCVTTNKTDFYREPHHFRFLQQQVLPALERRAHGSRRLRIWSAGCSTGEEPYTIALALAEALGPRLSSWDIRILASDIDTKVLETAASGTYVADRIDAVPSALRETWFSPSETMRGAFDIDDRLRRLITFRRINFADTRWPIQATFDLIFCRNVIIYFDRDTQARLFERFAGLLASDGHLVIGHSETLNWLSQTFTPVRGVPTVYRLGTAPAAPHGAARTESTAAPAAPASPLARRLASRSKPANGGASTRPRGLRQGVTATPVAAGGGKRPHTHNIVVGGVFAGPAPAVVRTVLGSCVAACLYDPTSGLGGMNHFLLPADPTNDASCTRYGVQAMEVLINELMHLGADRRRLRAKVFGASDAIPHAILSRDVQRRNASFVREFLDVEAIPLDKALLGGPRPLEVLFEAGSGRAFVRELTLPSVDGLGRDEDQYGAALLHRRTDDDVTLF